MAPRLSTQPREYWPPDGCAARASGEPVEISFRFVGYDRDNQHYIVQFADVPGRKHESRCKANVWQGSLYWQQTPDELLSNLPVKGVRWDQLSTDPSDSKEQLIDDLVAEDERPSRKAT